MPFLSVITRLLRNVPGSSISTGPSMILIASFWLSENERERRLCSRTKKSESSRTSQQKAACGELHFIRFLVFDWQHPPFLTHPWLISDLFDKEWCFDI